MNDTLNFLFSLGTVLVLGGICAFLIYLNKIKEEFWEEIKKDLKSEDKDV